MYPQREPNEKQPESTRWERRTDPPGFLTRRTELPRRREEHRQRRERTWRRGREPQAVARWGWEDTGRIEDTSARETTGREDLRC